MLAVVWEPQAARDFDRLPTRAQESIYVALARLAAYPQGDVKALHGPLSGTYRLRVGEYRIRFRWSPTEAAIIVIGTAPRGSAHHP